MAMQTIKNGGFVAEELSKINENFALCAEKTELPTKTSDLTNDSGFVTSVPTKVSQLQNDADYVKQDAIPTKTSDLQNDSNFATTSQIPTVPTALSAFTNDASYLKSTDAAFVNKVDKETGKGLSTEDFTTAEKNKLAGLAAPTTVTFTTNNWTNGTFTTPANGKVPVAVMRKNGSNYGAVLVDVQIVGTNVVITSDETFEGYVILA